MKVYDPEERPASHSKTIPDESNTDNTSRLPLLEPDEIPTEYHDLFTDEYLGWIPDEETVAKLFE